MGQILDCGDSEARKEDSSTSTKNREYETKINATRKSTGTSSTNYISDKTRPNRMVLRLKVGDVQTHPSRELCRSERSVQN